MNLTKQWRELESKLIEAGLIDKQIIIPSHRKKINTGRILVEEFLVGRTFSVYEFAEKINHDKHEIMDLLKNKITINEELAKKFSKFFGNSFEFWMNTK